MRPDGQRYTHLRAAADHRVVRFDAADGSFAADITLDADGVVIDYPAVARRLPERVVRTPNIAVAAPGP